MRHSIRLVLPLLIILHGAGCATGPRTAGQCPEVSRLRCMTRKICSHDHDRGCQVCTCEDARFRDREERERQGLSTP